MNHPPELEQRLARNLDAIMGEIDAPPRSRLERALLAMKLPEPTARLVAATPVLRAGWLVSVGVVLLFASVAAKDTWQARDQLAIFLALAPVVPVAGVALAYGPQADRVHEVALAAPLSGLRLLLLRTATVVGAAMVLSLIAVALAPTRGWLRLAWLLPAAATTAVTLAAATWLGMRRAAGVVATLWLLVVIVVGQTSNDATAPFAAIGQGVAAAVAVAGVGVLVAERRRLDRWRLEL